MAFCRLCKKSAKEPNKLVKADSLMQTFVFCLKCRVSDLDCNLPNLKATTLDAVRAIEAAGRIISDLSAGPDNGQFRILVWGPSPSSKGPLAEKRVQIRNELVSLGFDAVFSEDLSSSSGVPLNIQEAVQLANANLVICLASDFGPIGEAYELIAGLGPRALVWFDERARSSYSNSFAENLGFSGSKIEFYNGEFIECCAILKGSVHYVKGMRSLDIMGRVREMQGQKMRVKKGI